MNITPERFPTYKPLSPVLRIQTTYGCWQFLLSEMNEPIMKWLQVHTFGHPSTLRFNNMPNEQRSLARANVPRISAPFGV